MARCRWLLAIVWLWVMLPASALQNYQATYNIYVRGINAGTVQHRVKFTPDTYQIQTVADPSFAAKILGYGVIHEAAIGSIRQFYVQPKHYQRSMNGDAGFRLVYYYRPLQHEIDAQIGNHKKVLKYHAKEHPLDVLALIVQTLLDDEHHHTAQQYTLVSDDKIRTYTVEKLPDETWKDRKGHVLTVRAFRQINGERQTKIYFADNPLRLVELTQMKGGKTRFSLKLIDYQALQ